MMTKDAVTVTVDAISFMKVEDPIKAILEVRCISLSVYRLYSFAFHKDNIWMVLYWYISDDWMAL